MPGKEQQENLVARMKQWQKLETAAVAQTARIIEMTEHPLIRLVAEIIQRDSQMHHRAQQFVIDSLEKASIPVPVEQLTEIWDAIEEHIRIERRTIETAKESLALLKGSSSVLQQYVLSYLLADEQKHDKLLADLELIKRKMYP
jgi:hypothetical protein